MKYTVTARRDLLHAQTTIQTDRTVRIGQRIQYRGLQMVVTNVKINPHEFKESVTDPGNCDICHFFHS
jgi:hypothetical protein